MHLEYKIPPPVQIFTYITWQTDTFSNSLEGKKSTNPFSPTPKNHDQPTKQKNHTQPSGITTSKFSDKPPTDFIVTRFSVACHVEKHPLNLLPLRHTIISLSFLPLTKLSSRTCPRTQTPEVFACFYKTR